MTTLIIIACAAISVAAAVFCIASFVSLVRIEREAHEPADHPHATPDHSDRSHPNQ